MLSNPFAQISKKRAIAYGTVAAAIVFLGCAWLLYLGIPPWRVLLVAAEAIAAAVISVGFMIWVTGGEKKR